MKPIFTLFSFISFFTLSQSYASEVYRCPSLLDIKALINKKLKNTPFSPPLSYHGLSYIETTGYTNGYSIDISWQIQGGGNYIYSDLDNLKDVSKIGYMAPSPQQPWHMFMCVYPMKDKSNDNDVDLNLYTPPTADDSPINALKTPNKKECAFSLTLLQNAKTTCTLKGNIAKKEDPTDQGSQISVGGPSQISRCSDTNCSLECTMSIPTPNDSLNSPSAPTPEKNINQKPEAALATSDY